MSTCDSLSTVERLRRFMREEVIPAEAELNAMDENWHASPLLLDLQASAKAQGLWALGHPEHLGGGGTPFMEYVKLNEFIGLSDWGQRACGTPTLQDVLMLDAFASESVRERWLQPLVDGKIHPSTGLTEPDAAGSDPTQMTTTARLDGDSWVISGRKWFITHANRAAFTTVFCRTDDDPDPRHNFSAIVVPTDAPGYTLVRLIRTMGNASMGHGEITLDEVRVPKENLLGERGSGLRIAQTRLGPGRIFHCMRWLGQASRALELMCDRANSRFAHHSLLSEKGEIRRHVAESAIQLQASRLMVLDAARRMDAGQDARVEISMAKVYVAKMLHDVIDRAIQVFGAAGLSDDFPLDRMYREARFGRILDGPDEVHRMVIARRILADYEDSAPWLRDLPTNDHTEGALSS